MKQNLLDKGRGLTLNAVTALLSVHECTEREHHNKETEKKQKAEQLVLYVKSAPDGDGNSSLLFNNLLHGAQSQSVADYLLQVAYNFCLRRQRPPS